MRKTPLKKQSQKTKERNQECKRVFFLKLSKEGYMCQHCKKVGTPMAEWNPLTPHHADHNRNNNSYENILPVHLLCQTEIHSVPRDHWELYREV